MGELGYIEGERCNRHGCDGIMAEHPVENCSCHISPPCGACTEERGYCTKCGADVRDERIETINDYVCNVDAKTNKIWEFDFRHTKEKNLGGVKHFKSFGIMSFEKASRIMAILRED